jgi:hypothetical protein
MTEYSIQNAIRADAARHRVYLFRNNSGVLYNPDGTPVRFGLGNDSKRINDKLKSSDLIGFDSHGRFISVECKPSDWRGARTDHERAQLAWINLVRQNNGIAGFASSLTEFRSIMGLN